MYKQKLHVLMKAQYILTVFIELGIAGEILKLPQRIPPLHQIKLKGSSLKAATDRKAGREGLLPLHAVTCPSRWQAAPPSQSSIRAYCGGGL